MVKLFTRKCPKCAEQEKREKQLAETKKREEEKVAEKNSMKDFQVPESKPKKKGRFEGLLRR